MNHMRRGGGAAITAASAVLVTSLLLLGAGCAGRQQADSPSPTGAAAAGQKGMSAGTASPTTNAPSYTVPTSGDAQRYQELMKQNGKGGAPYSR